jgi:hypothetical protein
MLLFDREVTLDRSLANNKKIERFLVWQLLSISE